jgi:hypothetical protein
MAYAFPEGSKFYFSETFAAPKTITVMTNASPTVATSVAHGFVDGDELLLTSGWEDATDTVFKADALTADTFSLLDLDTTDTNFYTPGGGANSTVKKISAWTEIPQVLTIATSGGDARFTTIQPLARRNAINIPTGFNATTITLTLGHDPSLANYKTLVAIGRRLSPVAFKMVLSGGFVSYGYGHVSVSEQPSLNVNQANQVSAAFTLAGRSISYAN